MYCKESLQSWQYCEHETCQNTVFVKKNVVALWTLKTYNVEVCRNYTALQKACNTYHDTHLFQAKPTYTF